MPKGKQIKFGSSCKDEQWATYTGVLGCVDDDNFHVVHLIKQTGIWPKNADGTDVNSVDRSRSERCLVTGDDFGMVSLFKYPALGGKPKLYGGHSSHVTTVRFSGGDNRFVFSAGGADTALAQWLFKQ
eukprot:jgi/Chlat1/3398/Chrsp23S03815